MMIYVSMPRFPRILDIQRLDVTKYEDVEEFFKYVDMKYENFEVLVNNAGIRRDSVLAMM